MGMRSWPILESDPDLASWSYGRTYSSSSRRWLLHSAVHCFSFSPTPLVLATLPFSAVPTYNPTRRKGRGRKFTSSRTSTPKREASGHREFETYGRVLVGPGVKGEVTTEAGDERARDKNGGNSCRWKGWWKRGDVKAKPSPWPMSC